MDKLLKEAVDKIDHLQRTSIANNEFQQLGHRIVYDTKTGWSKNIFWCYCDPKNLDENGYQVRLNTCEVTWKIH